MRAYVFADPALAKQAGRFVWLSIDTDKQTSAAFLARYPVDAWPTLMVIDPVREEPVLKWLGSASVAQLETLLDESERSLRRTKQEGPGAELARADRLVAAGKLAEAVAAYRTALASAGALRPRAVESLVTALEQVGDDQGCANTALDEGARLPRGSSFANAVGVGLTCALEAPAPAGWASDAATKLEPLVGESLMLPGLLADDRSSLYEILVDARTHGGDAAGAKKLAAAWLAFLEAEAARAPDPHARSAFDPHRVSAAIALGEPARALPALLASERDLPQEYEPPYLLAIVYRELGRLDEARAATDRALVRVYGPRRLRVLQVRASILAKRGDRAAARATLEQAIETGESLPQAQRSERAIDGLKKDLAALQ